MESRSKQQAFIEFLRCEDLSQVEIVKRLKNVYKDEALNQPNVSRWLSRLREDNPSENNTEMWTPCNTLDDKPRSGRPSTSRTDDKSFFTNELIQENRGITIEELAASIEVSVGSAFRIVKS